MDSTSYRNTSLHPIVLKMILFVAILCTTIASLALYSFFASLISGQTFREELAFYFSSDIFSFVTFIVSMGAFMDTRTKELADKSLTKFFIMNLLAIPLIVIIFCLMHKNGILTL